MHVDGCMHIVQLFFGWYISSSVILFDPFFSVYSYLSLSVPSVYLSCCSLIFNRSFLKRNERNSLETKSLPYTLFLPSLISFSLFPTSFFSSSLFLPCSLSLSLFLALFFLFPFPLFYLSLFSFVILSSFVLALFLSVALLEQLINTVLSRNQLFDANCSRIDSPFV